MKRLKDLRGKFRLTQAELAERLGVSQQTVARWERGGAEPSLAALRDLATLLGTSVDDLVEFEATGHRVTSQRYWVLGEKEVMDGFWGHLGLLLPGKESCQWYPITIGECRRISSNLEVDLESGTWLVVTTLNNRALVINPDAVLRIRLLDDAADQPSDDAWQLSWDGYEGLSAETYRAMSEYFWDPEAFEVNNSEVMKKNVEKNIEVLELDERCATEFLDFTYVHLSNGTRAGFVAEGEGLFSLTMDADCQRPEKVSLTNEFSGELNYFPPRRVALVDMPLTRYQDAARESLEELEA